MGVVRVSAGDADYKVRATPCRTGAPSFLASRMKQAEGEVPADDANEMLRCIQQDKKLPQHHLVVLNPGFLKHLPYFLEAVPLVKPYGPNLGIQINLGIGQFSFYIGQHGV